METITSSRTEGKSVNVQGMEAVILDMDGVITRTATVHRKAWRQMFDEYFSKNSPQEESMSNEDYARYLDGKPRYKGVRSFLESRNIQLPYGDPSDEGGKETICGLGNRKNELFLELVEKDGVDVFEDTIQSVKNWRSKGLKTAVVSSSKNCKEVLEAAKVLNLFDVRIDGKVADERNLEGKPEADIFIEAANDLGTTPAASVVFEDAISGVQAGTNGNFAFVVGVNRGEDARALYENGADIVINSFEELDLFNNSEIEPYFTQSIPSVFGDQSKFNNILPGKVPVLFLDYDGTLSPIVKRPQDATLSEEMKHVLRECASKYYVSIVSGRDMDDVKSKVGLEEIIYAGSHGFRISGPNDLYMEHPKTKEILPKLDKIEEELNAGIGKKIKGIKVDRKRYAIALHYRDVDEEYIQEIIDTADDIIRNYSGIKKGSGKKIVELKPDLDWHKGKAIQWIANELGLWSHKQALPIYIGDDVTDEDAFKALSNNGIGILVGFHDEPSAAKYRLKNVYEVRNFLQMLANKDI